MWSFIRKARSGTSLPQSMLLKPAFSTGGKWFSSISELLLSRFINCLVDGDLSQLIIEGNPAIQSLALAWKIIYEEFSEGMADREGLHRIKLQAKINRAEFDYDLIQLCVKRLSLAYSPHILETLKQHIRVTGEFNPEDQNAYFNDLQVILTRSRTMLQKIDEMKAEYAILSSREGNQAAPTKQHFDTLIAQVSLFAKFHIQKQAITVGEFIEYYRSMRANAEALEKQMLKHKR